MFVDSEEALLALNVEISEEFIARRVAVMKSSKQWIATDYKQAKGVLNNLVICASKVLCL